MKKFKIGNSKVREITNVCKLFIIILDKSLLFKKPPAEIMVKDKLKESNNLTPDKINNKIIKIVKKQYVKKTLVKLADKLL